MEKNNKTRYIQECKELSINRRGFMKVSLLGLGALVTGSLLGGCEAGSNQPCAKPGEYLKSTHNLHFNKDYVGIDNFPLMMENAKWLVQSPDFEVYKERGEDINFEAVSYKNGIYLNWSMNLLMRIVVFEGWSGKVEETGIKIGDNLDDFLSKYPNAKKGNTSSFGDGDECWRTKINYNSYKGPEYWRLVASGGSIKPSFKRYREEAHLTADFDKNQKIKRLRLDSLDPNYFTYFDGPESKRP